MCRDAIAGSKDTLREVLNHQQLSLKAYPHLVGFEAVILTPRFLGEYLFSRTC